MEVLIVGGGVGGLALARGLVGSGHRVRVLEAAPALRRGGAAFTVFSNGAAALAGVGAPLGDFGGRLDRLRFDTAEGRTVVDADLAEVARRTGYPVVSTPRARLIDHLATGVDIEFSREIVDVDVRPDRVIAIDATGGRHEADVVVGADGHRSAVRRAVLDPAPATANEWTTWQGLSAVLPELSGGTTGVCVVGKAGLVGMLPSGDGLLQWWFDVHRPLSGSPAAELAQRFTGYGRLVSALLGEIRDTDLESFRHVAHRIPDRWGRGGATLLGDAAHVFPPTQAQGANQAFEDAWVLSRVLRSPSASLPEALRRYEKLRAPRVRKVSRRALGERTDKPVPAPVRALLRLVPSRFIALAYASQLRGVSSVLNGDM